MPDENVPDLIPAVIAKTEATPASGAPDWRRIVDGRLDGHDKAIVQLRVDMSEIRTALGHAATKADVAEMGNKVLAAINGVLRDALNAVPARHAAIWGAVAGIATLGMFVVMILHL